MKKVFGQTARNLKREVNKKVLKVPGIEQMVLDATSNEPWGPHGTHLAEIAQATRNNHEYQLIMAVIWRRINDTGKKWRHVFKALTVLEYLVAHGSQRVIDEIREHAYQISTLADFLYVDSGGRDQGINVRKKSQSLVSLLNDKDRIQEVRQKAQANKDKYGIPSSGGSYRQSQGSYSDRPDDDNYGYRADERNGYGDDERYQRSRDSDERYGRDTYKDDSYRGRGNDDNQFRSRNQSVDRYPDCSFGDDDRQSSRSSGGKVDDQSQDERESNLNSHNAAALPSYEEATGKLQDIIQAERDGETVATLTQSSPLAAKPISPSKSTAQGAETAVIGESVASHSNIIDTFDEFDPRGSVSAVQPAASSQDLDIFGFSASDSADPLALVPANNTTSQSDTQTNSVFGTNFFSAPSSASPPSSQPNEDPFGDAPFKAIPQENIQAQPQHLQPVASFQPSGLIGGSETLPSAPQKAETFPTFDFGDGLGGLSYFPTAVNGQHAATSPSFSTTEFSVEQSSDDILDSILPRTGSVPMFSSQEAQPAARADAQSAQMNPFQPAGLADLVVAHASLANTQTDQMNPFQPSGALAPVAQGPSTDTQTAEIPFKPSGFPAPVASQEMPTNTQNPFLPSGPPASQELTAHMQVAQMNFPQQPGVPVLAVSQGSPTNMETSQTDFFQPLGPSASKASEPITHVQTAQSNSPKPSGLSVPPASQGPQTIMQSSQMNFFQSSGLAVPVASQDPQTNMHTAQMNFFQPSGLSTSAASQGLRPNIQTDQLNFLQPSALPMPAASQGSQARMQIAQPNSVALLGLPAPADSQGLQTHSQATQLSFPQPSGLPTPAPNMQGGQFGSLAIMHAGQAGQFGDLANMQAGQAGQFGAPANMQGRQFGVPANMQAGQFGDLANMHGGQFGVSANMQVGQFGALASQGLQANGQTTQTSSLQVSGQSAPVSSQASHGAAPPNMQAGQFGTPANLQATHVQLSSQSVLSDPFTSQAAIASGGLTPKPNPTKEKFETKSTVWADTLSRGLVNLDISGPKTNPLANIGVDFDAINRREKRLEPKSAAPPATSTIVMGKAMGSGSGMGRSAASGLAAPPNPMMGAGMGMGGMGGGGGMGMGMGMGMRGGLGMGMGGGMGMGMGGPDMGMGGPGMGMGRYGGNMNQPPMGMNMVMNVGMGQGAPMQPPGQGMPDGGYNPMMGMVGYGAQNQQQYGGGYR